MTKKNSSSRQKRQIRTRRRIRTGSDRKRLSVFRSNKRIYAQIIDDRRGRTIASASELEIKPKIVGTKRERAQKVGELIAKKAKSKKISAVVFDRGSYRYHGRVKALAEKARQEGLKF